MPGFTIKNLMDLDDATGGSVPGLEARFARSHIGSEHIGLTHMKYGPDTRTPYGHSHRQQEEVYVVIAGSGKVKLDDEILDVGLWDIVRVAPETVRAFHSGPDGLELLIAGSDRPADGDGVPGPDDFWPA
jgi:mannose-6-phosphate isomerase-like protein (cupin superfamily)